MFDNPIFYIDPAHLTTYNEHVTNGTYSSIKPVNSTFRTYPTLFLAHKNKLLQESITKFHCTLIFPYYHFLDTHRYI